MTAMRRLLAVLTALLLAGFGAVVLIAYVSAADARAVARAEEGAVLVPVLVVDERVPAGTPAADVADLVSTEQVPARLKADDALVDLSAVEGLTAMVDLLPGDQVLAARFADPAVLAAAAGDVQPDPGTQEVSLALDPQRAVGGVLTPGDRVGVFVSSAGLDPATNTPTARTTLAVDRVLVTAVERGGSDAAGASVVTVTLSLSDADAAAAIAGMEQDAVWLSLQEPVGPADNTPDSSATTTGADQ